MHKPVLNSSLCTCVSLGTSKFYCFLVMLSKVQILFQGLIHLIGLNLYFCIVLVLSISNALAYLP